MNRHLYRYVEDALRDYVDNCQRMKLLDAYLSASSAPEVLVQGGEAIAEQERIAERRIQNAELQGLTYKTAAIKSFWEVLSDDDRALVRLRYFERGPWSRVAMELHLSEQACRCRRAPKIIRRAVKHFFGELGTV